jgi:hypothetical protein
MVNKQRKINTKNRQADCMTETEMYYRQYSARKIKNTRETLLEMEG